MLLAQIPQTARVSKKEVKAPDVAYQGEPQFQPIEKTTVSRAVNTDKDIIKVGDLYYMCFQGVWFMAKAATGPWEVTGTVPETDLRDPGQLAVAPRDLRHRRGRQHDDCGDVFASARGLHRRDGRVGLRRVGHGLLLSALRLVRRRLSRSTIRTIPTYGYSAWYNPWTGTYGRGAAAYGPYGGAGVGARYNPRTGTYARGAAA